MKGSILALSLLITVPGLSSADAPSSEFLGNTPKLEPIPGVEGSYGWQAPKMPLADYDKFLFDPVEIFLAPDSPYKGINSTQMQAISATMRAVMVKALEPDYPVVSQPGKGVARVSIAIANLSVTKKKRKLIGYTPVGLAVGGIRQVADALSNISIEGATVEAEFVDTQTGERVGVRVATKPFAQGGVGESAMSWEALETAFEFYAKNVRAKFDEAHQKK